MASLCQVPSDPCSQKLSRSEAAENLGKSHLQGSRFCRDLEQSSGRFRDRWCCRRRRRDCDSMSRMHPSLNSITEARNGLLDPNFAGGTAVKAHNELAEVTGELLAESASLAIPARTICNWMKSEDIEVLGAVFRL